MWKKLTLGMTALAYAAAYGHDECARLLLDAGADAARPDALRVARGR